MPRLSIPPNASSRNCLLFICLIAISSIGLSGCASITGSQNQPVSVETRDLNGSEVKRAECKLNNNHGQWYVSTPSTVMIVRSSEDMLVTCEKDNYETGYATVVSSAKGIMAGNILFGGVIGLAVDHAQGSGYDYPNMIPVVMGKRVTIKNTNQPTEEKAEDSK
jgi:hypothetical protein